MSNRQGVADILQQCRALGWIVDLTPNGALTVDAPTEGADPHLQGILEANRRVIHGFLVDSAQRVRAPNPNSFTWRGDH